MKSFIIGMAKCMDLGGTLTNQKTIEEVIAEDWKAIGSDMFKAIGDYEKHKKTCLWWECSTAAQYRIQQY